MTRPAPPRPWSPMAKSASMQLLVSVTTPAEALTALEGGADLIDAKDPRSGALGPVGLETLGAIHAAIAGRRPVTAALGEASGLTATEELARDYAAAGAAFVKLGFGGTSDRERALALATAAVRGAALGRKQTGVVAVAYADRARVGSLEPGTLLRVAAEAGAGGVLIDTAEKEGPGLRQLIPRRTLMGWVADAHRRSLFVALAGKLTEADLPWVQRTGAEIAGVRGAACVGGRLGHVTADRVRLLRAVCRVSEIEPIG